MEGAPRLGSALPSSCTAGAEATLSHPAPCPALPFFLFFCFFQDLSALCCRPQPPLPAQAGWGWQEGRSVGVGQAGEGRAEGRAGWGQGAGRQGGVGLAGGRVGQGMG